MSGRAWTPTGDLADAIARADGRQLQLTITVGLLVGSLVIVMLAAHELRAARRRERAEFSFMLDAASDAVHVARQRVDAAERETPPPAEPAAE